MSKAFTKETEPEDPVPTPTVASGKNYVTPNGLKMMQDELQELSRVERPKIVETVSWAASNGDRSENGDYIYGKKRLREIDRRMRFLIKRLDIAEVVDPKTIGDRDQVLFGATVTYADEDDNERTIRIVGTEEADMARNEVSWISPIARALHKSRVGDTVEVATPSGPKAIEVIKIRYEDG
jgi:transcription elongation factor GreB